MGPMRRPYRPYDSIVEGDVIDLAGKARRVEKVSRDEDDRVRFICVNRLRCGYSRQADGSMKAHCDGPVVLYHTDLLTPTYRFRGIIYSTTPGGTP